MENDTTPQDLIESTWALVGYKIRPTGNNVFLRTYPREQKSPGGLWLPPSKSSFYDGLPHNVFIRAVICATGPDVRGVKVGDIVGFTRHSLKRYEAYNDSGSASGWVAEPNLHMLLDHAPTQYF